MTYIHPPAINIFPGVTANIHSPKPHRLPGPWIYIEAGVASLSTPFLTRESANALRALADRADAAWAEIDRAGQPSVPEAQGIEQMLKHDGADTGSTPEA